MNRAYRLLNVEGRWAGARLNELAVRPGGALTLLPPTGSSNGDVADRLRAGSFVAAPASYPQVTAWGLIRAELETDSTGHIQLATCATDADAEPPPLPPPGQAASRDEDDTPAGQWRAAPLDVTTLLGLGVPARRLWVGGWLYADGPGSPALRQVRVEAADDDWLELLPALYRKDPAGRRFLSRLLALLRSEVTTLESRLQTVPALFDPMAAPDSGPGPTALERLAGWVGFPLWEAQRADTGAAARRRHLVATAIPAGAHRGTSAGLSAAVRDATGVPVEISEPGTWCSIWSLGTSPRLGVDTMLAASNPEGAVLGSTATLGAAELVDGSRYGAPALSALAGRVTVAVTAADLGGRRESVAAVVDQERPAYARTHLCVIEARARVGAQSRVGIDAIVAGPAAPATSPTSPTEETSR